MTPLDITDEGDDDTSFFEEWAAENGIKHATIQAETRKIDPTIKRATDRNPLVVIGATDRGWGPEWYLDNL